METASRIYATLVFECYANTPLNDIKDALEGNMQGRWYDMFSGR